MARKAKKPVKWPYDEYEQAKALQEELHRQGVLITMDTACFRVRQKKYKQNDLLGDVVQGWNWK